MLHNLAGKTTEQSEKNEILTKTTKLQIQLMEVLEQSGRPLDSSSTSIRKYSAEFIESEQIKIQTMKLR